MNEEKEEEWKEKGKQMFKEDLKKMSSDGENIYFNGATGKQKIGSFRETKKEEVYLPSGGKLSSEFAKELGNVIGKYKVLFYRVASRDVVEITSIKEESNEEYTGFNVIRGDRFITLAENFMIPVTKIRTQFGMKKIKKSMSATVSNTVLNSPQFHNKIPVIKRIFTSPIPILHNGELTFPKKGYDERFKSYLPFTAPELKEISLEEAKENIKNIYKEFCFQEHQDYINAIAGLLTPFLRGLFPTFNTRTPLFIYMANRERAGKDYCANITQLVHEGYAIEDPPISTGEKHSNNNDELRKKILSAMIGGRKILHFANNKGYINNSVLEGLITSKKYSDRALGKNEILDFDNELDVSLSGNVGIGFTPDLANRTKFIRLFLDIEDANARSFDNPNLHQWVSENRGLILSSLYSLVKNWFDNGCPKGKIPFASFPEWAEICGGIMESAGYDSPCIMDKEALSLGGDTETRDMKILFELCFEKYPNQWITKQDIKSLIINSEEDIFSYIDFLNKSDQTKFGQKITKFVGRVLSNILLEVQNSSVRASRQKLKFTKNKPEVDKKSIFMPKNTDFGQKSGNLDNLGNLLYPSCENKYEYSNGLHKLPKLPRLPQVKKVIELLKEQVGELIPYEKIFNYSHLPEKELKEILNKLCSSGELFSPKEGYYSSLM